MGIAYAHGLYEPLPEGLFSVKWDWDPTLLFFLLLMGLYIRGIATRRIGVARWQRVLFFVGVGLAGAALLPPVDPLSDRLFFAHMIQHMIIVQIAIPLMLFGAPFYVVLRGMPRWMLRHVYRPALKSRLVRGLFRVWARPLVALAVFDVLFFAWHIPFLYNLALLNDAVHLVEHASFAVSAMFLWRNIIDPWPMRAPLAMPVRLLYLGAVMVSGVMLSAFLTFYDDVLYAYQGIPQPRWWDWGLLQDQRLGGLIMWVPGEFLNLIALSAVFLAWARRERAKEEREQAAEEAKARRVEDGSEAGGGEELDRSASGPGPTSGALAW